MTSSPDANASVQKERKKPGRTPTSCAECRRLKLRCDRKVPCENCFKRGCGTICPTGSLTTGKGNRLILATTAELHQKIELMAARIRELEEALRRGHVQTSDDLLPLMSGTDSLASPSNADKAPLSSTRTGAPALSVPETDTVIDTFGTLTIGTRGETSFMSSTARAEYLIGRPLEKVPTWATLVQNSRLPPRVINASILEHDITPADDELRELVLGHRPPLSEAVRLCEIYLEWAKTLWNPLSRCELLDELVGSVYRADSYESIPGPHALSLLFSIFALASLFDLSRPPCSIEAYEYHILSRVSLQFSSPCITTTLQTVFTLENNLQWLDFSDSLMDPSRPYIFVGLGVKLAYRMGLHLHSARFQLEKSVVQKRSMLFWQMFLMDTLLSFYTGRPPNVSLDWIDVPYPDDESPVKNDEGELEMSWRSWSWRFAKLLHEVLIAAFGAKIPTHSTILELDRKIRDFPIPSHLQLQCTTIDARAGPQIVLQRLLVLTMKESVLLNIHRRYFLQALQDSPGNLLKHKYGPSVMAMYRSAWRLIVSHSFAVDCIPEVAARIPFLWSQAVSAAIVMCMIVTRASSSNMAASSRHEIDVVYEVFKKAAPTARIAAVLFEHVEKLWHKSHESVHPRSECILSRAELERVGGGTTSVISQTNDASSPSTCPSAKPSPESTISYSNPTNTTTPPCVHNSSPDLSWSSIHPRIMQDMQSFDGFRACSTATGGFGRAIPERFSRSMIDTQRSQFCMESEMSKGQTLNTFQPAQPQPFQPLGTIHATGSVAFDPAWQSFMEQLGF